MTSLVTTKLFSLKLWKPAKRDQKLVSPAQLKKASYSTKLNKRHCHRRTEGSLRPASVPMVWGCRKTALSAVKWKYHLVWILYIIFTILSIEAFQHHRPQHLSKIVLRSVYGESMPTVQCLFVGEFEQARDSIKLAPLNMGKLA